MNKTNDKSNNENAGFFHDFRVESAPIPCPTHGVICMCGRPYLRGAPTSLRRVGISEVSKRARAEVSYRIGVSEVSERV